MKFGDKKPYGERKFGDKPGFGEKKIGEKKFGDKPSFGERRFGDRKPAFGAPRAERKPRPVNLAPRRVALATLLAALCTRRLREKFWLAALMPVLVNGVIVGAVVHFCYSPAIALPLCMHSVAEGEAVA